MTKRRHALITGSSGGIGSAIRNLLDSQGWLTTGIDRHGDAETIGADLSLPGEAEHAARIALEIQPIDAVIHTAAVQPLSKVGQTDTITWQTTLQANVLSVDEIVRRCLPELQTNNGSVVVISSVHADATTPGLAAYSTSKAALHGWVRAAALDLAPMVRVNAVQPGAVLTPMLKAGFGRTAAASPEAQLRALSSATPMRAIADPEAIAQSVNFLLDPALSGFITGSFLRVDGGALLGLATE